MDSHPSEEQSEKKNENTYQNSQNFDIKTFLSWSAPGRPFSKKGRQFYLTLLLIVFLIEIILFLFSEYQLMLVVVAVAFLSGVLASVPPRNFHYKITSEDIKVEDYFYIWQELYDFYFKRIEGEDILIIRARDFLPGELKLSLGNIHKDHVRQVLVHFLPYREFVKSSFMEKSSDWLSRNFPLEKRN